MKPIPGQVYTWSTVSDEYKSICYALITSCIYDIVWYDLVGFNDDNTIDQIIRNCDGYGDGFIECEPKATLVTDPKIIALIKVALL